MRFPVVLLASILAFSSSAINASGPQRLSFLTPGHAVQPADTGDTVRSTPPRRSASRDSAGESRGRPLTECPMPVERPDPALSITIPTKRDRTPKNSMVVPGLTSPGGSQMPVVRSGCWNPLDSLPRERDSTRTKGSLRQQP